MDLLMTIGIILLILWLLGLVTSYTLGGFIHPIGVGRHRHLGPCYSGPPPHPLDPQAWAAGRVYLLMRA